MKNIPLSTTWRRAARVGTAILAAGGLMLLGAGVAAAHVTVDPSTTAAGSYSVLTFGVPHGCDGSSTTEVALKIPDGINSVTPTVNPGWTVDKVMQTLDTPLDDGHGGQLTERVDQVVYTAITPLPDGMRDKFELSVRLPDEAGATLTFPAVQTCEEGEIAWIETAEEGQPEPDSPAPAIVLTAGSGGGHHAAAGVEATDGESAEAESADSHTAAAGVTDTGSDLVSWIALGVGALGLLLAIGAFLRRPSTR